MRGPSVRRVGGRGGAARWRRSVAQLDWMTRQTAALVEESAAAAEKLREPALQLLEAVAVFRTAG